MPGVRVKAGAIIRSGEPSAGQGLVFHEPAKYWRLFQKRPLQRHPEARVKSRKLLTSTGAEAKAISARDARLAEFRTLLDLSPEDSWRNVYAVELDVRPRSAPTTWPDTEERGYIRNPWRLLIADSPWTAVRSPTSSARGA